MLASLRGWSRAVYLIGMPDARVACLARVESSPKRSEVSKAPPAHLPASTCRWKPFPRAAGCLTRRRCSSLSRQPARPTARCSGLPRTPNLVRAARACRRCSSFSRQPARPTARCSGLPRTPNLVRAARARRRCSSFSRQPTRPRACRSVVSARTSGGVLARASAHTHECMLLGLVDTAALSCCSGLSSLRREVLPRVRPTTRTWCSGLSALQCLVGSVLPPQLRAYLEGAPSICSRVVVTWHLKVSRAPSSSHQGEKENELGLGRPRGYTCAGTRCARRLALSGQLSSLAYLPLRRPTAAAGAQEVLDFWRGNL